MSDRIIHHVGRVTNTDRRCVIVYPQNPHNPGMALIVDTDALPPRLHDGLMNIVESVDAQTSPVLANVLARRVFSDTGIDMINELARSNALQPMPIDNVTLYPRPNNPIPLAMVLNGSMHMSMDHQPASQTPSMDPSPYHQRLAENTQASQASAMQHKYNTYLANQQSGLVEEQVAVAQSMLMEANELVKIAQAKQEQAFRLAPSLRPQPAHVPQPVPAAEAVDHSQALNASQSIVGQPVAEPVVVQPAAPVAATAPVAAPVALDAAETAETKARKAKKAS